MDPFLERLKIHGSRPSRRKNAPTWSAGTNQSSKEAKETHSSSVSILSTFEDIEDPYDWTIGTHGLQVYFMFHGRGRSATFLPDVAPEQGWSQDDTLEHLFRKGGWDGSGDWRDLSIDMQRYQSTKSHVSYARYQEVRKLLN